MGRNCGWLTAETARRYHSWVPRAASSPGFGDDAAALGRARGLRAGARVRHRRRGRPAARRHGRARLRQPLRLRGRRRRDDRRRAGVARGEEVQRDAFGHVKLDTINPGAWFGKQFAEPARRREDDGAEERLLLPLGRRELRGPRAHQAAAPTSRSTWRWTAAAASIGQDEERGDELRAIEFARIKGGKRVRHGDAVVRASSWTTLGQPLGTPVATSALTPGVSRRPTAGSRRPRPVGAG